MPQTPKAIIFDMDGVIINTEPLKAKAHVATVNQLGGNASTQLYATVMGQSQEIVSNAFIYSSKISCELDEYIKIFGEIYHQLLDKNLEYMPGMPAFIQTLPMHGYLLGLVSSSSSTTIRKISKILEFSNFFNCIVSSDDVKTKKPSPEPYLLALQKLGITGQAALVFEDSEAGIISAHESGISVIAIRHAFNQSQDFSRAIHTIDSFVDGLSITKLIEQTLQ